MSAASDVVEAGDALVVGAGLAGLAAALSLAPARVTVLSPAPLSTGGSSAWAQGGIAAAFAADDSPDLHAADTRAAACGIADADAVSALCREARDAVTMLAGLGVPFDRCPDGSFALGREAAHSRARIVHVHGDSTGRGIVDALVRAVGGASSIRIVEGVEAIGLAHADGRVVGAWARHTNRPQSSPSWFRAGKTILATGGIGALYQRTTNPASAAGAGIAMAARVGARLADLEFVQFHPTVVAIDRDPAPLVTEAVRGAGAIIVNDHGERFLTNSHPHGELAPRDVVARAIWRELRSGRGVFLDATRAVGEHFADRFPSVYRACQAAGIDPATAAIPIAPAAHYHMGGIAVDLAGRTSLQGLWACGEVAATGAHGANRLGSNSLLEATVFARRAARDMLAVQALPSSRPVPPLGSHARASAGSEESRRERLLRRTMSDSVGVVRDRNGLATAVVRCAEIERAATTERLRGVALVGRLIATAALRREESRGSHFRSDWPTERESWHHRSFLTLAEADAVLEEIAQSLQQEVAR